MSLSKFESMLKTNHVYFFDSVEFEEIIHHYLDTGKHALAKKAVKLGLEQHPSAVILKLLKVELFIFEDKLEKASQLLNEIAIIAPYNDEVFIQKATICSKNNEHTAAITLLEESLVYTNDPGDIWSLLGMEHLYLDDFTNAGINFAKCLTLDTEDYASLYNVVYCFDMENKHEEAIDFLTKFIDKNPYCEVAWHQLGRQFFVLKAYPKALQAFDFAVLIDEDFIGGYLEKAKTLECLKRYEEAIDNYLVTIELDDPTAFAYIRVGACFEELGTMDLAIQYYKKAVHEDPLLEKGWFLLTNAYCKEKAYQKALYYINKALEIDEFNTVYWRKYGELHIKLDLYEEAVKAFNTCLELEDDALEMYIALVDVLLFLGDYNDALKILVRAKNTYKEVAEIEYRMCGLFFLLHQEETSLLHLKNAVALDVGYHAVIKELYPIVFKNPKIQTVITAYKKATE